MDSPQSHNADPKSTRAAKVGVAPASGAGGGWWQAFVRSLTGGSAETAAKAGGAAPDAATWRYYDAQEIARGGMGIIFRVRDGQMERVSAMKVALPYILKHPVHAERFVAEAKITGQLEHPNIVPVHDMGRTPQDTIFYTMKLIDGEPLSHILDKIKAADDAYLHKYDRHQLLVIFRKVCDAVAYAHAHGIIHRDIKPENIMVGAYGEVLLMDWGLGKHLSTPEPADAGDLVPDDGARSDGTATGIIKGTPCYMSPEQAHGRTSEVDCQTDVFLLGATLYHVVTLVPPYQGKVADEVIAKAAMARYPLPLAVAREQQIPEELSRIICKSMAPRKADRYANVQALCADLDALMSGASLSEQRTFAAGDTLMQAGDTATEGYVIISGEVEVFREVNGERVRLGVLGPGDVVGEMAVITDEMRSASVIAIQPTRVAVITIETMKQELKKLAPWMGRVVGALARRLQATNANVHPLMLGPCERHVARQWLLLARHCQRKEFPDCGGLAAGCTRETMVREISRNLALPQERVRRVLDQFVLDGLLELQPDGNHSLQNTQAVEEYLRRMEAEEISES